MRQFFLSLVIGVVVVGGAGFANYHRNAPLDAELADRPYALYRDADIESLLKAHTSERDRIRGVLSREDSDPTRVMNGFAAADFVGKLNAFEKFQQRNNVYKRVNGMALEHEIEIEVLEKEKNIRKRGLNDPRKRMWRRILTF